MELAGKRVLLTGATGGLGAAAAQELARQGAVLVLTARDARRLGELESGLAGAGHEAIAADLAEPGAAERVVEQAGRVDVLIANAGLPGGASLVDLDGDAVASVVRVNLEAPLQMARCVIPQMRERRDGHIVLVASLAGKFALPDSSLYSGTKFGLRGVGWSLRPELAKHGIGVSLVTPGFISEAGMFAKRGRKPPPGAGTRTPDDFARAVIEAIVDNRDEVVLAPPPLRLLGQASLLLPGLFARILGRARPERTPPDSESS
jgi:short-subunit dehydrogenase